MTTEPMVCIVDDDPHARESVCELVRSMSIPAVVFHSAEDFLSRSVAELVALVLKLEDS